MHFCHREDFQAEQAFDRFLVFLFVTAGVFTGTYAFTVKVKNYQDSFSCHLNEFAISLFRL